MTCRVLGVSTSGYYAWLDRPTSARRQADMQLIEVIRDSHTRSRETYGSPRVHAELRLGQGLRVGRKRVERLMREHRIVGVHRLRRSGCTVRDPAGQPSTDLVNRQFVADRPNALWVSDITQHRTDQGWVYCAVVLDTYSRRVIGWSIADHVQTKLVIDALEMACLRQRSRGTGTVPLTMVVDSDHGGQYTSWAFGQRLRTAGLLGSMGSIGDCFDNALAESFFSSVQIELLDRRRWRTRQGLANAIFE